MFTTVLTKLKTVWEWVKAHKWPILGAVAILAIILFAYSCGRYQVPTNVVEKERIVTKTEIQWKDKIVDHNVEVIKEVQKLVYVKAKNQNKDIHTIIVYRTLPSGEKITTVETIDKTKTTTDITTTNDQNKVATINKTHTEDKSGVKKEETIIYREKIVQSAKPGWGINAGVGYDFLDYQGTRGLDLKGVVIELEVNRRLVGPVWIGVWGVTTGVAGIKVGAEF